MPTALDSPEIYWAMKRVMLRAVVHVASLGVVKVLLTMVRGQQSCMLHR